MAQESPINGLFKGASCNSSSALIPRHILVVSTLFTESCWLMLGKHPGNPTCLHSSRCCGVERNLLILLQHEFLCCTYVVFSFPSSNIPGSLVSVQPTLSSLKIRLGVFPCRFSKILFCTTKHPSQLTILLSHTILPRSNASLA